MISTCFPSAKSHRYIVMTITKHHNYHRCRHRHHRQQQGYSPTTKVHVKLIPLDKVRCCRVRSWRVYVMITARRLRSASHSIIKSPPVLKVTAQGRQPGCLCSSAFCPSVRATPEMQCYYCTTCYIGATHGHPGIDRRVLVSTPVEDVGRGTSVEALPI